MNKRCITLALVLVVWASNVFAGRSSDQSMQSFIAGSRTARSSSGEENGKVDFSKLPVVVTETLLFPQQFSKITFHRDDDNRVDWMTSVLDGTQKLAFLVIPKASWSHISGVRTVLDKTDLYNVGLIASVKHVAESMDGKTTLFVQAITHARVTALYEQFDGLYAQLEPRAYREELAADEVARLQELGSSVGFSMPSEMRDVRNPEKIVELLYNATDCGSWIDREQSQSLIESISSTDLVKKFHEILSRRLERLGVRQHLVQKAYEGIEKANRKYLLLQQLKAIREELGENKALSITEKLAALPLPDEVRVEIDRKLSRLEGLMPESPETEVIQTYLDWIVRLPWGKETVDNMSITHAKQVLDEDHYGLKDIKERILDFIAVRSLNQRGKAPILCLVGPPGVGKTSLAQSIARSLGRNFARISLGGLHDEAEIRGHRSTYIGSMPGRFIQAMKRAGSMNPVILVDEIDKIGRDHRGDPSSAMLEVLDPEQNSSFHDNYLNIPFDLSKVLFVVTANTLDTIPAPLRDRMEVINLSGYALEEKVRIAEQYLVKKANQDAGLAAPLAFSSELLADIIQHYTREAGVRELERLIRKACAKGARAFVEEQSSVALNSSSIEKYLGPRVFQDDAISEITLSQVGVANGLAWTSVGGELLKIEAMLMPGKGKLILTGSLGNVMQESARAAVSYARAHAQEFGIASSIFTDYDLHVHVPSGGVPKDGPSAGIALLSSVLSAYTGRKIDGSYAMTGELNLRGNVMPIGGVKEKVLAAKRNGITHVLLPKKNKKDYVVIDEEITRGIEVIWVSHADEVLSHVLMAR